MAAHGVLDLTMGTVPHCVEDDAIHQAEMLIAIHKKLGLPL